MKRLIEIIARTDNIDGASCEYFCKSCLQLRLSFREDNTHCRNCGSPEIIIGKVGTLDKPALIKKYSK